MSNGSFTNRCPVCAREIRGGDHVVPRRYRGEPVGEASEENTLTAFLNRPKADTYIHKACSADAAKRWLRAGRPCSSPLDWLRRNGIRWTGVDRNGRPAADAAASCYRR
jgi:hypothetical protein